MTDVPDEVQRWTAKRKAAVVLAIVNGETWAAEAAREHGLGPVEQAPQAPDPAGVAPDGGAVEDAEIDGPEVDAVLGEERGPVGGNDQRQGLDPGVVAQRGHEAGQEAAGTASGHELVDDREPHGQVPRLAPNPSTARSSSGSGAKV